MINNASSSNSEISEETSSQNSDSVSYNSSSSPKPAFDYPTLKKRGRPRKSVTMPNPALYNSPLGYNYNTQTPKPQYMMYRQVSPYSYPYPSSMAQNNPSFYGNVFQNAPNPYMYNYHPLYNSTYYNTPYRYPPYYSPYPPTNVRIPSSNLPPSNITVPPPRPIQPVSPPRGRPKRPRRTASVIPSTPKVPVEEEEEPEQISESSSDIEKLLSHNTEDNTYLVKYKNKSYIHCAWLHKDIILQSRSGNLKIRRFKPKSIPYDPEYIIVDRILLIEEDRCLIKWKKLPYEFSTFEEIEKIQKCENYSEALTDYKNRVNKALTRNNTTINNISSSYRPPRDEMVRFEKSPIFKNDNKLRDYQLEGLNWFLNRWYHRQSCIMADEMGLGKTVQSVVFVNTVHTIHKNPGPFLVIAPLSTLIHWEREFIAWTDLRVLTYHGSSIGRDILYNYEFYYKENNTLPLFDVLVTTYEMAMAGISHLKGIPFSIGVFDEAHRLKNVNSKASQCARELIIDYRVLLSGTPLQNNLGELWSLLNFIDPNKYDDCSHFLLTYKMNKSEDVERLQSVLKTLMLRRMKDDVEKSIPLKEETIVEVELTMIQKRFYRAILEKNIEFLRKGDNAPNLLNAMMELRKCCIHPYLIVGAEEKILGEWLVKQRGKERGGIMDSVEGGVVDGSVKGGVMDNNVNNIGDNKDSDNVDGDNGTIDTNDSNTPVITNTIDITNDNVTTPVITTNDNNTPVITNTIDITNDNTTNDTTVNTTNDTIDNNTITNSTNPTITNTTNPTLSDNTFNSLLQHIPVDEYYKIMIQSSGKMVLLDKLLNKLKDNHKVLIFSQMTKCLDLLGEYLNYRKYKYERIDGSVRGDCRQAAIDRFCDKDSDVFVFLLCTRAGGVGINLTAADTVIIFDSDWNPQNDLQAQARCHRIGQVNEVKVYRLVTRNTYEREMFDKAGLKLGLDKAILQRLSYDTVPNIKYKDSIELLLRKGAYGVLMENDEVSVKFCEEDIDQILERRSKVVKHENVYESGNIFSKASFFVEEEIDDPDFWDNLVNKKKTEEDEGRVKRQVRRLGREGCLCDDDVYEIDVLIKEMESKMREGVSKVDDGVRVDGVIKSINVSSDTTSNTSVNKMSNTPNNTTTNNTSNTNITTSTPSNTNTTTTSTPFNNNTPSTNTNTDLESCYTLLVFLTSLLKGVNSLSTLKYEYDPSSYLNFIINYCLSNLDVKMKEDYSLHMDIYIKGNKKGEIGEYNNYYIKYGTKFLLRVQIIHILGIFYKCEGLTFIEKWRGWSYEDDKRLVNWVLSNGYGNYPCSVGKDKSIFRGKSSDELNSRIRKIILGLNKRIMESKQEEVDMEIIKSILCYGRITEKNRQNYEKVLGSKIDNVDVIIERSFKKRRRRDETDESVCYRVKMFDKLKEMCDKECYPVVRKSVGLPRKWNLDKEMIGDLLCCGVDGVCEKYGIGEDVVVRRCEVLVKGYCNEGGDESEE